MNTIRISTETYSQIKTIINSIEVVDLKDVPTSVNVVNVAISRLLEDWNDPTQKEIIEKELILRRKNNRSKMGNKKQ
jgi:hypothetical protein